MLPCPPFDNGGREMIGYYNINPTGSGMPEDAFGPRFFKTRFYTWIRESCTISGMVPVLEMMLTSGQVLDVSNIIELKDDYMLVSVFLDEHDCTQTYHSYIRYQTIYSINLLNKPRNERTMGFNTDHEPRHIIESATRQQLSAAEVAEEYTKKIEKERGQGDHKAPAKGKHKPRAKAKSK